MKRILFTLCLTALCWIARAGEFNILDFGANASALNTRAIQSAIDACSASGGGRVVVPEGIFRTGTLMLRDDVELHLCRGGVLMGSDRMEDYPFLEVRLRTQFTDKSYYTGRKELLRYRALLFAEGVRNMAISGCGRIDGNGGAETFQLGEDALSRASLERPVLMLIVDCRDVEVSGVELRNSAYWMQCYLACENVTVRGIRVWNHCNFNNDGIDIDSRNVLVENCEFDSDDDAVCLKSHDPGRWCENVVIRNCTVRTNCNGVKLGTGSLGGFRNIRIENIRFRAASADFIRGWQRIFEHIEIPNTMLTGLAFENVDGGQSENIEAVNLHMENVQTPIFIKLGMRTPRSDGGTPALRNIRIDNLTATSHSRMTSSITGYAGCPVQNVTLTNIRINSAGGTTAAELPGRMPRCDADYPENRMFGFTLPASGLWTRDVTGLVISNAEFSVRTPDARPDLVFEASRNVTLTQLRASENGMPVTLRTDSCRTVRCDSTVTLIR